MNSNIAVILLYCVLCIIVIRVNSDEINYLYLIH